MPLCKDSRALAKTMDMYKKVALMFLWAIIGTLVFMLITWGVFWVNANNIVQDRLSELVIQVSEDNCLSNDGTSGDTQMNMFDNLLKASETSWLEFRTHTAGAITYPLGSDDISYKITDLTKSKGYYSYIDAPQKGSIIRVELTGYLKLPLFFNPNGSGSTILTIPITKTYVTME